MGCRRAALYASAAAIRAATELGAYENPRAALHLKYAQDQVARADALMKEGDEPEASWVLLRADADAELAVALAKEDRARQEALAIQQQIRELRQRTSTNGPAAP
jgi:hypothetical protein